MAMRAAIGMLRARFSDVEHVSTDSLAEWLNVSQVEKGGQSDVTSLPAERRENLILLDTRSEEEFKVSHLHGAHRVDFEVDVKNLIQEIPALQENDPKTIVCYCSIGYRSSVLAQKLQTFYKSKPDACVSSVEVYNLEGSIFKWANERRPMVNSQNQTTAFTHPYNVVFGKLLDSELRKETL